MKKYIYFKYKKSKYANEEDYFFMSVFNRKLSEEEIKNAIDEEEKTDYHKDIVRIGMNGGLRLALQIIERMEK